MFQTVMLSWLYVAPTINLGRCTQSISIIYTSRLSICVKQHLLFYQHGTINCYVVLYGWCCQDIYTTWASSRFGRTSRSTFYGCTRGTWKRKFFSLSLISINFRWNLKLTLWLGCRSNCAPFSSLCYCDGLKKQWRMESADSFSRNTLQLRKDILEHKPPSCTWRLRLGNIPLARWSLLHWHWGWNSVPQNTKLSHDSSRLIGQIPSVSRYILRATSLCENDRGNQVWRLHT